MKQLPDIIALWRNPVFTRYRRSRLRLKKSIFWCLLVLVIATFMVTLTYTIRVNTGSSPQIAARDLWLPLLVLQGVILMAKGTGSVSAGLIQDKIDGTLDYQRLTPLPPINNLVGYLFGLPVLEYLMVALTLPHLMFIIVVGNIPLSEVFSIYLTFFVCVILYHLIGISVGIVMKRWIIGYLLSIALVFAVNVVLPVLVSQFGLRFFQFLSVWPVIGQKLIPLVAPPGSIQFVQNNPYFTSGAGVPFYNTMISAFAFTLLMQGGLILTFALMALRRWRSETRHSLSKPYALAFLGVFLVILIGNVWPALTGGDLPFAIFGRTDVTQIPEVVAVAFPATYGIVTWLIGLLLFAIVIPDHHGWLRGLRRARKYGISEGRPWTDDSASLLFMSLFIIAILIGFAAIYATISGAGLFSFMTDSGPSLWRLPTVLALTLVYTLLLVQVVQLKPMTLVVLLLWFVPILIAIVLGAIMQSAERVHAVIASISPIATLLLSSAIPLDGAVPVESDREFQIAYTGVATGIFFLLVQIAVLFARRQTLERRFKALSNQLVVSSPAA